MTTSDLERFAARVSGGPNVPYEAWLKRRIVLALVAEVRAWREVGGDAIRLLDNGDRVLRARAETDIALAEQSR